MQQAGLVGRLRLLRRHQRGPRQLLQSRNLQRPLHRYRPPIQPLELVRRSSACTLPAGGLLCVLGVGSVCFLACIGGLLPVSILTGPEGPVQPAAPAVLARSPRGFQSSPAPKGRCNDRRATGGSLRAGSFNPHRPRRAGATDRGAHPAPRRAGFNPHRPRRAGATVRCLRKRRTARLCFLRVR